MKALFLVAVLALTAGCTPVRNFRPEIRCEPFSIFLPWQEYQRWYELLNNCRKPPMIRRTTVAPQFPPTMESDPPLTPSSPDTVTPTRRGDV